MTIDIMDPTDSMFDAGADALVVPVNCVGVLGAGLAAVFAEKYPAMVKPYEFSCRRRNRALANGQPIPNDALDIGRVLSIDLKDNISVVCLPTKDHWKVWSSMDNVRSGVDALAREVDKQRWRRIAIPALGCGLGGLEWDPVRNLLENTFMHTQTHALIYPPR